MKKIRISSFRDASLIRKFNIFFIVIAIIPISILAYIYYQLSIDGVITITLNDLNTALILCVCGVMLGYFSLLEIFKSILQVTRRQQDTLNTLMGSDYEVVLEKNAENEIAALSNAFSAITTRLEENVKNLHLAQKTLYSVMERVGKGITTYQNIDHFLELILETVVDALLAKKGFLLFYDESTEQFLVKAAFGVDLSTMSDYLFDMDETVFNRVMKSKQPIILRDADVVDEKSNELFEYPLVAAPLMMRDNVFGVMVVCGRRIEGGFYQEEMTLLHNLCIQTSVAIENDRLSVDAEQTYLDTLSALALAVEAKDPYSRGHLDRVADLSVKLANHYNLDSQQVKNIRDAAKIHDLGKIGVTDDILDKPGQLTEEEWLIMRKHPEIGESIIKPIKSLKPLCDLVRHHHEKLDGTGYPDGLVGDEISFGVRILMVADIFDALTTDRSYRQAYTPRAAIKILKDLDTKIDQNVVDALESILKEDIKNFNSQPTNIT